MLVTNFTKGLTRFLLHEGPSPGPPLPMWKPRSVADIARDFRFGDREIKGSVVRCLISALYRVVSLAKKLYPGV